MTHGEQGGCCGGSKSSDKKSECCNNGGKIVTFLAVVVAIGSLAYAVMHSGPAMVAHPKVDVSTLVKGEDSVVAKIDGKSIKKSDVAMTIKDLGANIQPENLDTVLPAFLEQYINLELIGKAAKKEGVASSPEVVSQIVSSQDQIIRAAYLRGLFEGKITEDTLKAAYKAKYEDQPMPIEVKARHILLDDEAKAKDIIAKLDAGGNFAELAKQNSKDPSAQNGGDLGFFLKSDMVKEFGDAAFALTPNTYTKEPVKTQFGWHIIKVEGKRQRAKPTYEEAKQALEQEARQVILDAKLKELRTASKVEILLPTKAAAATPAEESPAAGTPAPENAAPTPPPAQ